MNIIETTQLTKTFKRYKKQEGLSGSIKGLFHREYEEKEAVKGMDFAVEEGGFVGLIGPNGAGKTTLVKMLTGIIAPTSGEISVMGYYPNKLENDFKRQYAVVMGQKSQLFFELTTEDTLHLFKQIYGSAVSGKQGVLCGTVRGQGTDGCAGTHPVPGRKDENGTDSGFAAQSQNPFPGCKME